VSQQQRTADPQTTSLALRITTAHFTTINLPETKRTKVRCKTPFEPGIHNHHCFFHWASPSCTAPLMPDAEILSTSPALHRAILALPFPFLSWQQQLSCPADNYLPHWHVRSSDRCFLCVIRRFRHLPRDQEYFSYQTQPGSRNPRPRALGLSSSLVEGCGTSARRLWAVGYDSRPSERVSICVFIAGTCLVARFKLKCHELGEWVGNKANGYARTCASAVLVGGAVACSLGCFCGEGGLPLKPPGGSLVHPAVMGTSWAHRLGVAEMGW